MTDNDPYPTDTRAGRYALGYASHTDRVRISRQAASYAQQVLQHIADHGTVPAWMTTDPDVAAGVARHLQVEADRTNPTINPDAAYRNEPALYRRLRHHHGPQAIAAVQTCRDLRRMLVAELGTRPGRTAADMIDGYADGVITGAEEH